MGFFVDFVRKWKNDKNESKEYIDYLIGELEKLKKETNEAMEKDRQTIKALEEKIQEGQNEKFGKFEAVSKILETAQSESEKFVTKAMEEAEEIRRQAKLETEIYRQKMRNDIDEQMAEEKRQFYEAKKQMLSCLELMNKSQTMFQEAYDELGKFIKILPIQIDEAFVGTDFDFLLEKQFGSEEAKMETDIKE